MDGGSEESRGERAGDGDKVTMNWAAGTARGLMNDTERQSGGGW